LLLDIFCRENQLSTLSVAWPDQESDQKCRPWFALQVRSRLERSIAANLQAQGYECFLPTYKARRRWSDRVKEVEFPLFPGYLFSRFDLQDRLPVLVTPGVLQIVGIGRNPVPVDENEINSVRRIVRSGFPRQPWPFLQLGDRVRIERGPLYGIEGILLGLKGHHRIVVSVSLLQRSVALEIDEAWVRRVHAAHPVPSLSASRCLSPATP